MSRSIEHRLLGAFALPLLAAALLRGPAFSQQRVPTPPDGGGLPPTSSNNNSINNSSGVSTPSSRLPQPVTPVPSQPEDLRPVYLAGRVMIDEGMPPPESAIIESLCQGVTRIEAYTDSKGRFSFQFGDKNNSAMQDASIGGSYLNSSRSSLGPGSPLGGPDRRLMGCELRARLPGFRSESVMLMDRRAMDNPDVGTILLHRLGHVEGRVVSATTLQAPKAARNAYEKARDLARKGKPDQAAEQFEKAVEIYPAFSVAWCELGSLQASAGKAEEARQSFTKATEAEPKYIDPYLKLSSLHLAARRWRELASATDAAILLDPYDYPLAFLMNAVARYNTDDVEGAEKSVREAERLDPRHQFPKSWQLLGLILAARHDYSGAAGQMREYLRVAPSAPDAATVRSQLAEYERLTASARVPGDR
jgi:tetratricopeptide (TPR) repeat protein